MEFSQNGDGEENIIEIDDEDNFSDKKIKQRILSARDRIEVAHDQLYSERVLNPELKISDAEVLSAWGSLVRAYIRDLGVFLHNDDLPTARKYREEVEIGKVLMIPQETPQIDFTKVMHDQYTDKDLRRMWGFERGAEIPKPRERKFKGLESIVERDNVLEEFWLVIPNPRAAPPNQARIEVMDRKPVPKHIYEKALQHSDTFLQNIGIGAEIDANSYNADGKPGI